MRKIHLILASLVVVLAVALGACGGSSSASAGDFCGAAKHMNNDPALKKQPSNLADEKKQLQTGKTDVDQLAAASPSQLKSDMQTMKQYVTKLANAANSAKSEQDLTNKAQAVIGQANSVKAASQKIDAYATKHCGISLSSGS